jgi:hypothetical protein
LDFAYYVKRSAMYAISRIQHEHGAWYWAVAFRRRGKPYYRNFYDVRRGGSRKALAAAIAWRDQQLAKAKALSKREFHQIKRSSNSSASSQGRRGAKGVGWDGSLERKLTP